jgi:pathogenesis-related protein 1
MTKVCCIVAAFFVFWAAANAQGPSNAEKGCTGSNGLSVSEMTDVLKAHNAVRKDNKLPLLVWDCKLADTAQQWAARGVFEHRTDHKYGESLFVSSTSTAKATAAVQQWMLEKPSWDNTAGTCANGKVCTHYTQIVWKKTATIGCGINRNAPGKWKVLLVCNYDPAGNGAGPAF